MNPGELIVIIIAQNTMNTLSLGFKTGGKKPQKQKKQKNKTMQRKDNMVMIMRRYKLKILFLIIQLKILRNNQTRYLRIIHRKAWSVNERL